MLTEKNKFYSCSIAYSGNIWVLSFKELCRQELEKSAYSG